MDNADINIDKAEEFNLENEIGYIQDRAAQHNSRVITFGDLMLFSTESGDAWLLDTADKLAIMLAENGSSINVNLTDPESIEWTGNYKIDGASFIYIDTKSGWLEKYKGYPTHQIQQHGKAASRPIMAAEREAQDLLDFFRKQTGRDK